MINYLRADATDAFQNVANRYQLNEEGGVAIWDVPPTIWNNAFNPILYTRTRYLFAVESYQPTQSDAPCIVTYSGAEIRISRALSVAIDVRVREQDGSGTTDVIYTITAGSTTATTSGAVQSILGIALEDGTPTLAALELPNGVTVVPIGVAWSNGDYYVDSDSSLLYRDVNTIDTTTLNIYRADGSVGYTMTAESIAGVTEFNVGSVVCRWLSPQLAAVPAGGSVIDPRLSVAYTIKGLGGAAWSQDYVAINGVAQVGETSSRNADEIITSFDSLTLYDGYPLDYSRTDANALVERVDVDYLTLPLLTEDSVPILTEAGLPIYVLELPSYDVQVRTKCIPPSPFYVRWINDRGGVDYYMFARRQGRVQGVESSTMHEVYVPNTATATTNRRTTAIKHKNTVTVGVENISATDYKALQQLPFSPTVEWYNETLGKWIELSVAKFGGEYELGELSSDFEVEFNLPQIYTRF